MGQSLVKNYLHIVFSTKYRQPLITTAIEHSLYEYLGGICKQMDCWPVKVGGYRDHVHILCVLSKKVMLMKLIQEVKASSSKWIKTRDSQLQHFYWQDGYGAFSVSPSQTDNVVNYIANQHSHHQKMTFQAEYRAFLKQC